MRRVGLAAVLALVAASPVQARPLGARDLADATGSAFAHWKVREQTVGWVGLQTEIASCFRGLAARPSQARAAYCIALDHYTLLDTLNFPDDLRPPYFAVDTVFARLDKAVAASTPQPERAAFARAVMLAMDDTLRAKGVKRPAPRRGGS